MADGPGVPEELEWIIEPVQEPPTPDSAIINVVLTSESELSAPVRSALERLVEAIQRQAVPTEDGEVVGMGWLSADCPQDCGDHCSVVSRTPCLSVCAPLTCKIGGPKPKFM